MLEALHRGAPGYSEGGAVSARPATNPAASLTQSAATPAINLNIHVDAKGATEGTPAMIQQALMRALPLFEQRALAAVKSDQARGKR